MCASICINYTDLAICIPTLCSPILLASVSASYNFDFHNRKRPLAFGAAGESLWTFRFFQSTHSILSMSTFLTTANC